MRFDDSLETVLSAEMSSSFGAQSTWRQLVDLIGRGRAAPSDEAIARLRALRADVPHMVRAASARGLAVATPPLALVALFAEDDLSVAAPVLRTAQLSVEAWTTLLPALTPSTRSILRHRRDLPRAVHRALESFGSVDFVLHAPTDEADAPATDAPETPPAATPAAQETTAPVSPFQSIAAVAATLPAVAEARRQAERDAEPAADEASAPIPFVRPQPPGEQRQTGPFQIAELVARIDAYQRQRQAAGAASERPADSRGSQRAETFRFETDANGLIRWIDGVARAPLIGLSLNLAPGTSGSHVDGVASGAFRRRAGFANARLLVDGQSDAAGQWRITAIPVFDPVSGRFTGYRGSARRPRVDECAEPKPQRHPAADALRQLVHELRTPTNAIAGFAEMIESQMLGPVPSAYRAHAKAIRSQSSSLLTAIDDIDMAARIETRALDLRSGETLVAPLLDRVLADLAPLMALRGAQIESRADDPALAILGDDRAVERLVARLLATLMASGSAGERICVVARGEEGSVAIVIDRPLALAACAEETLLTIDAEAEAERDGAPLLGTGFALRLARNLATELHGSLTIGEKALTLRLPAASFAEMEQVSSN